MSEEELISLEKLRNEVPPGAWGCRVRRREIALTINDKVITTDLETHIKIVNFTVTALNALPVLIRGIRERDNQIHVLAQDSGAALDLGKQIGRGEALAAFDEAIRCYANTPTISTAVLVKIRKAILESGEAVRLPPDQLRDELRRVLEERNGD